jgi:protein involved in polysaccharide export with SLBB domain
LPGDIIVVQKAPPIYITGEVVAPQGIYLKEGGTTLMEALSKVSGLKQEAKTKEIKIYRQREGSKDRDLLIANLDLIKAGQAQDIMLQPYDLIEVGKAKKPIGLLLLEFAIGTGKAAITAAANSTGYSVIY